MISVPTLTKGEIPIRGLMCVVLLIHLQSYQGVNADVLDPGSVVNDQLNALQVALHQTGVDVAFNLNVNEVARAIPERPRVGMLVDIPSLLMPLSDELDAWEQTYQSQQIGALAFVMGQDHPQGQQRFSSFYEHWLASSAKNRVILSYASRDRETVLRALEVLTGQYSVLHLDFYTVQAHGDSTQPYVEQGGRLYATAGQRWVMDSAHARDIDTQVPEFLYLGESMRRDTHSVINPKSRAIRRLASSEPAVFVKERLGDEFEDSTIPEIIVPGGIALGENAVFDSNIQELQFDGTHLWLVGENGSKGLPTTQLATLKASFDFAARAQVIESDAIVDIDERGKVRVSSALEGTDLGYRMVRVDMEPFNFVTHLDARKSLVIDNSVQFHERENDVEYQVSYEVRFLQADRMRIARTEAAIVYQYRSADDSLVHIDSWGPSASSLEKRTDFIGLGRSINEVADYAAWIALFRNVHDQQLEFTQGRYEFLKIDKAGRSTPSRI